MTSSTYRNKKSYSVDTYCTYYASPILIYHCSTSSSGSIVVMMIIRIDHRGHHALLEVVNTSSSSSLLLFNSKLNLYLDYNTILFLLDHNHLSIYLSHLTPFILIASRPLFKNSCFDSSDTHIQLPSYSLTSLCNPVYCGSHS